MNIHELMRILNKNYECKLWQKHGKCRIYFEHTSKVITYIELEVTDGNVVDIYSKCFYSGNTPTSHKWTANYTRDAIKNIQEIEDFIALLIKDSDIVN